MSAGAVTGSMRLRAERVGPRTVIAEARRTAPFHPAPAHHPDGAAAEVTVQDVGPGILAGDALRAEVEVGPDAELVVRGQGAARIHPAPPGGGATVETVLRVAAGGRLWWLPGEILPYAGAELDALTVVELAADARFALLEIVTCGRAARGERDAYRRLDLRLRIDRGGEPLLRERARLEPALHPSGHGGHDCAALLVAVGYPALATAAATAAATELHVPGGWAGVDGRAGLTVARAVGDSAPALRAAMTRLLETAFPTG